MTNLGVRVSISERKRIRGLAQLVRKKNRFINEADVIRALLGLEDMPELSDKLRKDFKDGKTLPPDATAEDAD